MAARWSGVEVHVQYRKRLPKVRKWPPKGTYCQRIEQASTTSEIEKTSSSPYVAHKVPFRGWSLGLLPIISRPNLGGYDLPRTLLGIHNLLEHTQIQHNLLSQPRCPLRMISLLLITLSRRRIHRIWVHQHAQGPTIDYQPWNECPELRWREEVDFEHRDGVRTDGHLPEAVDSELGNWIG